MEVKDLTIYCTICAGTVLHFLLLICIAKDPLKCFRNSASYLVGNLALADFIMCTLGLMKDMIFVGKFATIFMYASTTATLLSLFSMFSIAIDRYLLTVRPFTHRALLNGKRISIWIVLVWVFSFWFFIKGYIFGPSNVDGTTFYIVCITVSLLTGLIYLVTFFSLRKQGRNIAQHGQCRNQTLQQEFLKTITIVAFIQIFTLLPTTIAGFIEFLWHSDHSSIVKVMFYQMYWLNFSINPILYIWRLKNYRRTFCLIVCRIKT